MKESDKPKHIEAATAMVGELFKVLRIESINWRPHMPMVGVKHIAEASDRHGGKISHDVFDKVGCQHQDHRGGSFCGLKYDEHACDIAMMLQLKQHRTNSQVKTMLSELGTYLEGNGIDGIVFVDTPERYRIAKDADSESDSGAGQGD